MEWILCFFFVLVVALIVMIPILAILGIPISLVLYALTKEGERLSKVISFWVGAIIFFLLFALFSAYNLAQGGAENSVLIDDLQYVKIKGEYSLARYENGPFFIQGTFDINNVDSLAEFDDYLYGYADSSYFSLSLKDGEVEKDSIFGHLHLPASCTQDLLVDSDTYFAAKYDSLSRDWTDIFLVPFMLAVALAYLSSFMTKKLVVWLEEKYKMWRKKRNGDRFSLDD